MKKSRGHRRVAAVLEEMSFGLGGGNPAETAFLKGTPALDLATYLMAVAIRESVKSDKVADKRMAALVTELHSKLDIAELRRLGFDTKLMKANATQPILVVAVPKIKQIIKDKFTNNASASSEEAGILNFAANLMQKPTSDTGVKRAFGHLKVLGNNLVSRFMKALYGSTQTNRGEEFQSKLQDIVEEITGKPGTKVDAETIKELREGTDEEFNLARAYAKVKGELRAQMITDLASFFDENGGKPVHVLDAEDYLADLGYTDNVFPDVKRSDPLYVGMYSGKVAFFTKDGRRLVGGIPPESTQIIFPSTYNAKDGTGGYITYRSPNAVGKEPTKLYTVEHKSAASDHKFAVAEKVSANLTKFLGVWKKDLDSKNPYTFMAAVASWLIYLTGARVGSKVGGSSNTGKATAGALTLLVSNVKLAGAKLTIAYKGKKSVSQIHIVNLADPEVPRNLKRCVEELLEDKSKDEFFFAEYDSDDNVHQLSYKDYVAYLKKIGFPAGIHKIRHARGTQLATELLAKKWTAPAGSTTLVKKQKAAEDYVKEKVLTKVANLLGHKKATGEAMWQTSISNYINPKPVAQWFVANGLRVPKWVPKKEAA